MHYIKKSLNELAIISAGHPIRDAVRDVPGGDVAVVQIRNVRVDTGVDWASVARTNLSGRREPDWLKPGDVLFSARGQRNVAVCLDAPPIKAVCSPHFFLIRITDSKSVLPEFLAWQMNLPSAQQYFAQSATGSYIKSIRRQVLESLSLLIPSLDRRLIVNRQQELERIAGNLLTQKKRA